MKVILKADDFGGIYFKPDYPWAKFIEIVIANGAKASLGVIGKTMVDMNDDQIKQLKNLHDKGIIEFYNHSFNHMEYFPGKNSHHKEFSGTMPEYQIKSLSDCQEIVRKHFGYAMTTFGAPQNSMDDHALNMLNEHPQIQQVYAYQDSINFSNVVGQLPKKKLILLNGYGYLEKRVGLNNVNAVVFKNRFSELEKDEIVTFQMHPSGWTQSDRNEFDKVLKFLVSKNIQFITPSELL